MSTRMSLNFSMSLLQLSALPATLKTSIALIASDMDGTLTRSEKLTPALLKGLDDLKKLNISLLLVTGRSAGWVDALRYYLPIAGAIAENGGLYLPPTGSWQLLSPIPDIPTHRQNLAAAFLALKRQYPALQESSDNAFRLTDWTFDVEGISPEALAAIAEQCGQLSWSFTFSTVQCHVKPEQQNKAWGIQEVLRLHYPQLQPEQVLTIGDSPNDETMFNPAIFPVSVGVANILNYRDRLQYLPTYITQNYEVDGFLELLQILGQSHSSI
jgi:hydroxymethylpyrimidine pyrophosphatase-like HAD family hydrolase